MNGDSSQPSVPSSDAILDAARRSFLCLGFAGTSVRTVAKMVGVPAASVGSVYPTSEKPLEQLFTSVEERQETES